MLRRLVSLLLIRPAEQIQVGYFFLLFVTIGAGMALGRGTTDALFFKRYGIEYLPVMYVLVSLMLAAVSVLYAAFVDLMPSERFFRILFSALAGLLLLNWAAIGLTGSDLAYPAYFLLYEVASELLLVHGALYLGQNLVQTQSKRLMPVILAGHQIGVIAGGLFLATLSPVLGVQNILLVWGALLAASFLLLSAWHRRRGVSPYFRPGRKERSRLRQSVGQVTQGIRLMRTSALLAMASAALFFMVISTYVLCYTVNRIYTHTFTSEETLSSFFGILTAVGSTTALLLQIFVTNRVIRRFGVKAVNLIFPTTSLLSFVALLFTFGLPAAILGSFNKDALMPAFRNPVRNIFLDVLPAQVQGRARAMSIAIVMPLALLVAGVFLWVVQRVESDVYLPLLGMVAAGIYFFYNRRMNAAYVQEIATNLRHKLFVPTRHLHHLARGRDEALLRDVERGVLHEDDEISLAYSRVLLLSAPDRAAELLPGRMARAATATRDQFVGMLRPLDQGPLKAHLRESIGTADKHLDATVLLALFEARDEQVRPWVPRLLEDDTPRLRAAGVYGALTYPLPELQTRAVEVWADLLADREPWRAAAGVELIDAKLAELCLREPLRSACLGALVRLLDQDRPHLLHVALAALKGWPEGSTLPELSEPLMRLFDQPDWTLRSACLECSHLLPEGERRRILASGLEDAHPRVRRTTVYQLVGAERDRIGYLHACLTRADIGSPRAQEAMIDCLIESGAPPAVMLDVSRAKARDAEQMAEARATLLRHVPIQGPGPQLLAQALGERMHQFIDLALLALQSSEHDEHIAVIRAGLQSRDRRQIANACELLSELSHPELTRTILALFEESDGASPAARRTPAFESLAAMLEWGKGRLDPWLSDCIHYVSATLSR